MPSGPSLSFASALTTAVVRAVFLSVLCAQVGASPSAPSPGRAEQTLRSACPPELPLRWKQDDILPPPPGLFTYRSANKAQPLCLNLLKVKRDDASPSGPGPWLMQVEIVQANGQSIPFCLPDSAGFRWALAYREGQEAAQLTCSRGAYAKCLRLGYHPWRTFRSISLAPYHKACMHLMRADYLGDGSSHTAPGMAIDISDDLSLLTPSPESVFEGGWDQQGAVCLRQWRLPGKTRRAAAAIVAHLRGGYGEKTCSRETAKQQGALVFSGTFAGASRPPEQPPSDPHQPRAIDGPR